jgi:hypothetical protein
MGGEGLDVFPTRFQNCSSSSQCVPYDVPNSVSFVSPIFFGHGSTSII